MSPEFLYPFGEQNSCAAVASAITYTEQIASQVLDFRVSCSPRNVSANRVRVHTTRRPDPPRQADERPYILVAADRRVILPARLNSPDHRLLL